MFFMFAAKCTSKKDPASGRVNVTSDGQTTQAIYSCESGYFLDGGEILLCRPDGIWNGPDPVCSKSSGDETRCDTLVLIIISLF